MPLYIPAKKSLMVYMAGTRMGAPPSRTHSERYFLKNTMDLLLGKTKQMSSMFPDLK